jgi:signal transduction histidine kinase
MLNKNLFSILLLLMLHSWADGQSATAVFDINSGVIAYDELTKNIQLNVQKEKSVQELLDKAEAGGDRITAGKENLILAALAFRSGDKQRAIVSFKEAEHQFILAGNIAGQAAANCGVAHVFQNLEQADSAIVYFKKAIDQNHKIANYAGEVKIRIMLSKAYEDKENHVEALRNFKEALNTLPKTSDFNLQFQLNNSYAEELLHNGKDNEALQYLNKALTFAGNDLYRRAIVERNIGIVYFKKGDFNAAAINLEKSLQSNFRLPSLRLLRDTYLKQYASGKISGDRNKEQLYSAKYKMLKDSVENVLNSRVLSPDSFTLELKEKVYVNNLISRLKAIDDETNRNSIEFSQRLTEAELERLKAEEALDRIHEERMTDQVTDQEREDRLKELEKEKASQEVALSKTEIAKERQQRLIILLLSAILITIIVLLFLYNRYRLKRKSHADLDQAFAELQHAHRKLKETQEQLIRSEKMASLGQMTAGIAHEIQNPLNFVLNFSEGSNDLLTDLRAAKDEEEKNELIDALQLNLKKVIEHSKRADGIVKNMLQHSRVNKSERISTDLNKLAEEYLQLAYHGLRAKNPDFKCTIEKQLDPNLPMIEVIQQDLSRVFLNLFNNAFYAVNEMSLKRLPDYIPTVRLTSEVYGTFAILTIEDNGIGVPAALKEKIFEPFFTTKPTGQGTGLGLSLSFEIIKNHNAKMEMTSEEGKGTSFRMVFVVGGK